MKEFEILLPKRVIKQILPALHTEGDCGACALGGLVGCDVQDVYLAIRLTELARGKKYKWWYTEDGRPKFNGIARNEMCDAIEYLKNKGKISSAITKMPTWSYDQGPYGLSGLDQRYDWESYIKMALEAGYYALAMVDMFKKSESINHWILICGMKMDFTDYLTKIFISCSSTRTVDEEWVETSSFLKERGGFNVILVKP